MAINKTAWAKAKSLGSVDAQQIVKTILSFAGMSRVKESGNPHDAIETRLVAYLGRIKSNSVRSARGKIAASIGYKGCANVSYVARAVADNESDLLSF